MKFKKALGIVTATAVTIALGATSLGCGYDHNGDMNSALNVPQDYCRTYYEIFVRSFADSNNDGIGDLRGIINNLDYLNDGDPQTDTDLGINGIWLMPINPSPSYHKYDATDYLDIDPQYGTLDDFDDLVKACDERGIWLQMDLVLNHSSDRHPWFLNAVADAQAGKTVAQSQYMQMYDFVHTSEKPSQGQYHNVPDSDYCYLGNFSPSQPDLNLDNATVRDEIKKTVDFWLGRGVRSFRLDAVPWAYGTTASDRGTKNIEFWTWFNDYCNEKGAEVFAESTPNLAKYCYNVGEVWASSLVIDAYFATGMSNFNYGFATNSNSSFAGVANGYSMTGAVGLVRSFAETQATALEADSSALLSNFLSNHDNDRSAGYFGQEADKIKKAAGLYLLMPGNPYIYYGEEIGAAGSGSDPNRRLPFNWGDGRAELTPPPEAIYTGAQQNGSWKDQKDDGNSILSYYREAIKLRNRFPEIGRGVMTPYAVNKSGEAVPLSSFGENADPTSVNAANDSVAVYKLVHKGSAVLIMQNVGAGDVTVGLGDDFEKAKLVGALSASGSAVSVDKKGKVSLPAGCAAIFK